MFLSTTNTTLITVDYHRCQSLWCLQVCQSPSRRCKRSLYRFRRCVASHINVVVKWRILLSAGKDATQTFFGLHRHEVLLRPQYKHLQIGTVAGQEEQFRPLLPGELSKVPYAEPTWLSKGYYSPYYSDNHRKFQTAVREFFTTVVQPESQRCEETGKRISQEVVDKMRYVICHVFSFSTANQTHLLPIQRYKYYLYASWSWETPSRAEFNGRNCKTRGVWLFPWSKGKHLFWIYNDFNSDLGHYTRWARSSK